MTTKGRLFLVVPVFLVLVFGCKRGNPNAPARVTGKVTYKDKPVTAGTVTFHTDKGPTYPVPIQPDGTYTGTDMPAGDMAVTIETESANKSRGQPKYGGGRAQGPGAKGGMSPVPEGAMAPSGEYVKIPPKYAKKETSGFKVTLEAGRNTKDFALTD